MSARDLRSRGVSTVEGRNRSNPFPGKGTPPKQGAQYPKMVGMEPKVVRGDAVSPILPKGMVNPVMEDHSVGGENVGLRL